jgi:DNA-binding Lrp family transcriptional regulator
MREFFKSSRIPLMIKMVRKALILGELESQASGMKIPETLAKISSLPGVKDIEYIAGPYDFFLIVEADNQQELDKTVTSLREIKSIKETMTCLVLPSKKK